jgi:hypothetical protein
MNKRILFAGLAGLAVLAIGGFSQSAFAAASVATDAVEMCAPASSAALSGPKYVTNPATGGGSYTLNAKGCANMVLADVAYFKSQGFTAGAGLGALYAGPFTAQSTTSNSPVLPANAVIQEIIVQETTGNAVTGGLDVGVAGSSDQTIVAAYAVGANGVIAIPSASILKRVFPTSGTTGPVSQQIFFNAHTNWTDGASINVTILYRYF